VTLRSTFQRSRGIICKRLAPFHLERVSASVHHRRESKTRPYPRESKTTHCMSSRSLNTARVPTYSTSFIAFTHDTSHVSTRTLHFLRYALSTLLVRIRTQHYRSLHSLHSLTPFILLPHCVHSTSRISFTPASPQRVPIAHATISISGLLVSFLFIQSSFNCHSFIFIHSTLYAHCIHSTSQTSSRICFHG
jgi:hypothetical protein